MSNISVAGVIRKVTNKVMEDARANLYPGHGYRTGRLHDSILTKLEDEGRVGVVYTATEYAPYVEFGTVKMKEIPFLRPALKKNAESIKKELKDYLRNSLKNV